MWYYREVFFISRSISSVFTYIYNELKKIQKGINAFIGTMSRFENDYPKEIQEMKKESKPFLDMMESLSSVR
jgi:cell shape-determining protein MreC